MNWRKVAIFLGILFLQILVSIAVFNYWNAPESTKKNKEKINQVSNIKKNLPSEIGNYSPDNTNYCLGSFAKIVKQVSPALVSLEVTSIEKNLFNSFADDSFFGLFFGEMLQKKPNIRRSSGSGVIISAQGLVVTCAHVIGSKAEKIIATLQDGQEFSAKVLKNDKVNDIAILKIDLKKDQTLPFLPLGNSDKLEVGDQVLAFGNAFSLGLTVTNGIISARNRVLGKQLLLQTNAAVNPGNSGGALVDTKGQLIAVPNAILSRTGASHGVGFGIPANLIKVIVNRLESGKEKMPWLGINTQDLSNDLALSMISNEDSTPPKGVIVLSIHNASPAKTLEIKQGDIITKINNFAIDNTVEFEHYTQMLQTGENVEITLWRQGKTLSINFIVPSAPGGKDVEKRSFTSGPFADLTLGQATPFLAQQYDFDDNIEGVVILETPENGFLSQLQAGDIIVMVNQQKINQLQQAYKAFNYAAQQGILELIIQRANQNLRLAVQFSH